MDVHIRTLSGVLERKKIEHIHTLVLLSAFKDVGATFSEDAEVGPKWVQIPGSVSFFYATSTRC